MANVVWKNSRHAVAVGISTKEVESHGSNFAFFVDHAFGTVEGLAVGRGLFCLRASRAYRDSGEHSVGSRTRSRGWEQQSVHFFVR